MPYEIFTNHSDYYFIDLYGNLKKLSADFSSSVIIATDVLDYGITLARRNLILYEREIHQDPTSGSFPFFIYDSETQTETEVDYGFPHAISQDGESVLYEVSDSTNRVLKTFHLPSGAIQIYPNNITGKYGKFIWNENGIFIIDYTYTSANVVEVSTGLVTSTFDGYLLAPSEDHDQFLVMSTICPGSPGTTCISPTILLNLLDDEFKNPILLLSAHNHNVNGIVFSVGNSSVIYIKENSVYQIKI